MPKGKEGKTMDKSIIAQVNDRFRNSVLTIPRHPKGKAATTQGVSNLDTLTKVKLFNAVRSFDDFTEDNDPHGEHDFGEITIDGDRYFWKIDYYDSAACEYGVDDSDQQAMLNAYRVLMIMLADEY